MIRLGAVVAWAASAILFSFAAWQVVQASDENTTEMPSAPVVIESGLNTSTSTTAASGGFATSPQVPTTQPPSDTTTTTVAAPSTTQAAGPAKPSNPPGNTRVVETGGGSLSVWYADGEVRLVSATPNVGWGLDVEDKGPETVEIKFEQDDTDIQVWVGWRDGELVVRIDDEGDGEGEGEEEEGD